MSWKNWPKHGDCRGDPIFQAAAIMHNVAQILDVVKREWATDGCWSDWDQGVRDSVATWLTQHYAGRFDHHSASTPED